MPEFGTFRFGEAMFGGDTIYISPDLGWANVDDMLNPAMNPAVVMVFENEWTVVDSPPLGFLSPSVRRLYYFRQSVEIPLSDFRKLRGHNMRYIYRASNETGDGIPRRFILRLEA